MYICIGINKVAARMIKANMSFEEISELTEISIDEVNELSESAGE